MKKLQEIYIGPGNAILVIVDVQNNFCKPGGKRYNETGAQIMPGVVSAIQGLAERSRSAGIPVIYIQGVGRREAPEFTVLGQEPRLEIGSWDLEIIDELKPQEGDIIVQKFSHDSFYKTDLDRVLERLVPDPTQHYAIVTGGVANVCLYHAVMGFHLRDYWATVPVDSFYYFAEDGKQRALAQFSLSGAYANIFLSRSDLIKVAKTPEEAQRRPVPGT
ncbi:cysteine hydrolase family protein [Chloroflexota bacterium]